MSGGQLVVLDHSGRDVKRYPLAHGLVKLGSDESSDIRIMLDTVDPHHATVVVHTNQTVVRNVSGGELLVNDVPVSVAALRHGDVLTIGGRALRWEYLQPSLRRPQAPQPAMYGGGRKPRTRARASCPGGGGAARRDRAIEYALEMRHRASMPASAGGKQVAVVQPQRRDTHELNDKPAPRTPLQSNKRPRTSRNDLDVSVSDADADKAKRRSTLQNTTKATLWIESRKSSPRNSGKMQTPPQTPPRTPPRSPLQTPLKSPSKSTPRVPPRSTSRTPKRRNAASARKSTPLRLTVLKRAQSAQAGKVTKIEAPTKIDHTKQAALLLMTGHTPKSRLFNSQSPNTSKAITIHTNTKSISPKVTPKVVTRKGSLVAKKSPRIGRAVSASPKYRPVSKSQGRHSLRKLSNRSNQKTTNKSPLLPSPKKSALKNPLTKKSMRKTESIKFDLSNLEGYSQDSDVLLLSDTAQTKANESENEFNLRYSSSVMQSPSPRRSIHSRSSKILEKTLGSTITLSPHSSKKLNQELSRSRKTSRGSVILQNALHKSDETRSYSSRTTKTLSDISDDTVAFRTRTLSPSTTQNNLESYSIVDLVSVDSNESGLSSVYNSAGSTSSIAFATPQNSVGRKTRSTIDPTLLGSSTPYVKVMRMPNTSSNVTLTYVKGRRSSRRSKSVSTPENKIDISLNSTRISRAARNISRLTDSNLVLIEADDPDESPKSSRRVSTASKKSNSVVEQRSKSINTTSIERQEQNGMVTPENSQSPEEARTPVLSIQSLLDSSRNSSFSKSLKKRGRPSLKRKTIGTLSGQNKVRLSAKSKSMNIFLRTNRSRLSDDSYENLNVTGQTQEEVVTPKSDVKLVPEAVKNKHSTAKKPQSKRSIIDDLNESDIVKQLFNSPVKRKLSQSMIEFSRKQLFEEDIVQVRRPTRNTIALADVTPDNSLIDRSEAFSPERFVSPISTPSNSPYLHGIKRMFGKNTPDNDLRDVRGVKRMFGKNTPDNDLRDVRGVKRIFGKNTPDNDLRDVRGVKRMFGKNTPDNDLRDVRGVKALLRTPSARKSIRNDLTNVSGVKEMISKNHSSDVRVKEIFTTSPNNDLRRVSGVKNLFQSQRARKSPRNSLGVVRGVKALFNRKSPVHDLRNVSEVKKTIRKSPKNDLRDVRGVKHLFARKKNELNDLSGVEELFNVEEWLQTTPEKSKNSTQSRELQKLATDTVAGTSPLLTTRVRNSTIIRTSIVEVTSVPKSASELYSTRKLPIKKRSVVNASVERSKENNKSNYLPIKKRAFDLLHSTPMKGRQSNMTMNASELGRVSPIAPDNTVREESEKTTSNLYTATSRNPKIKPSPINVIAKLNFSPEKDKHITKVVSPKKVDTLASNVSPKTTRSRKTVAVSSPQRTTARKGKQESSTSADNSIPRRTRATRNNDKVIDKSKTPKHSRAKVQKATVVVMKPSPQIKPRATRRRAQENQTEVTQTVRGKSPVKQKKRASLVVVKKTLVNRPQPRVSRKSKQSEDLSTAKAVSPRKTRNNRSKGQKAVEKPITPRNKGVQKGSGEDTKPSPKIKPRTTRAKAEVALTAVKGKKVSPKESSLQKSPKDQPKTRGRKKAVSDASKQNSSVVEQSQSKPKRGRKQTDKQETIEEIANPKVSAKTRQTSKEAVILESSKTKTTRVIKQKSEEAPKSTTRRANKQEIVDNTVTAKSRTRKSPDGTQTNLSTRTRRTNKANNTVIPVSKANKRKSMDVDDRPTKVSKKNESRGKNKKPESPKTVASSKKPVAKKQASEEAPSKAAKSKKANVSVESQKEIPRSTRGRKAILVVEPVQRKRKNQVEVVEEKNKKARGGKSPAKPVQSPKQRTRSTRAAVTAEVSKPSGRSRRR